jgi:polygalacturonase
MSSSSLKNDFLSSRRTFLKGALLLGGAAFWTRSLARADSVVKMIRPPHWFAEAHKVVSSIKSPRIPDRDRLLDPVSGDARKEIQDQIDDLSQQGGGRLSLAAGQWRSDGPINLRSHVELRLERGCHLEFSGDRKHYLPLVRTRWEGTDLYGYSPCIYAYQVSDVALTGEGSLSWSRDGDIDSWRLEQTEAQKKLRAMGASGVPLETRVFGKGSFLRPSFIQFFESERVLLAGISVGTTPFWAVHLLYSSDVIVRGIKITSDRVNNDGVDVDSSKRVLIENSTFHTGDDCIAIKSGRDLDGRMVAKPSEDIVIRDCEMPYGGSAGVAIGSEMSGGVRRVYIFRCNMGRVGIAVNIKSNLDRGGFVEHVRVWGVRARECKQPSQVTTSYHGYMGGKFPPRIEDIELGELECLWRR